MRGCKKPAMIEINGEEAEKLIERIRAGELDDSDNRLLEELIKGFLWLNEILTDKKVTISRLKRLLFGAKTEKSEELIKARRSGEVESGASSQFLEGGSPKNDKKREGHGRHGVSDYPGAEKIEVRHPDRKVGEVCPDCGKGKLYELTDRGFNLRLKGSVPIRAEVYSLQKLRCKVCGKLYSSNLPPEAGDKKYDERAGSILAVLKYGSGMPFYRLEKFQENNGVPLPASSQWEIVKALGDHLKPVYQELLYTGAQGELIHNDDTTVKILELIKENKKFRGDRGGRKGMFTTGILSKVENHQIALFFSGRKHAGENLCKLLQRRKSCLSPPIQMCDALSRNTPDELATILANCMSHARRQFVDLLETFPEQSIYVIEQLAEVYKNDSISKMQNMTPRQRLLFHQKKSKPVMDELENWFDEQFDEKKIEPNSSLGNAIKYMKRHWHELTLFLRVEEAPLDNNILEQSLKIVIMNRKNAYFYKTLNGAKTGDIFMSIIQTCRLENVNVFEYLTQLQKYIEHVNGNPSRWLPWNYKNTMIQENLN